MLWALDRTICTQGTLVLFRTSSKLQSMPIKMFYLCKIKSSELISKEKAVTRRPSFANEEL